MSEENNKDHPVKKYTIDVSGLHAVMVIDAVSKEDALYASSEGWADVEIIWDDAEYTVREDTV